MIPRSEMVVNYSLVKRLIDLGVDIHYNHFMWVNKKRTGWQVHFPGINQYDKKTMLPAPTVEDIMPAMPGFTYVFKFSATHKAAPSSYNPLYKAQCTKDATVFTAEGDSVHNAIAILLIVLIKEGKLNVEDVNASLNLYQKQLTVRA